MATNTELTEADIAVMNESAASFMADLMQTEVAIYCDEKNWGMVAKFSRLLASLADRL